MSLNDLKKMYHSKGWTLAKFYRQYFGDNFPEAQRNFVESLAGYSIFSYLLNVKDRHNANILMDNKGHLVHIDFGFLLTHFPGIVCCEGAPFKLPYVSIETTCRSMWR